MSSAKPADWFPAYIKSQSPLSEPLQPVKNQSNRLYPRRPKAATFFLESAETLAG
jgi:hypothetical protein